MKAAGESRVVHPPFDCLGCPRLPQVAAGPSSARCGGPMGQATELQLAAEAVLETAHPLWLAVLRRTRSSRKRSGGLEAGHGSPEEPLGAAALARQTPGQCQGAEESQGPADGEGGGDTGRSSLLLSPWGSLGPVLSAQVGSSSQGSGRGLPRPLLPAHASWD